MNKNYFCLILVLLAYACEYEPNGEYINKNIKEPDVLTTPALDLVDYPSSTLTLSFKTNLRYAISSSLTLYHAQLFIDDQLFLEDKDSKGIFEFDPKTLGSGTYTMKVTVYSSSGTNSLADKVGVEQLVFSKRWTLIIDKDPPKAVEIKYADTQNGFLNIYWEPYTRTNFQKYDVGNNFNGFYFTYTLPSITNQNICNIVDPNYIGGEDQYAVTVIASDCSATSKNFKVNYPFPQIKKALYNGTGINFEWSKCMFPGAFKQYTLHEIYTLYSADVYSIFYSGNQLFSSTNVNDTVFKASNLTFGNTYYILETSGKDGKKKRMSFYSSLGEKFVPFWDKLGYSDALSSLYFRKVKYIGSNSANIDVLCRYSTLSNQIEDSIALPSYCSDFGISNNGKYLLCGSNSDIVKLDPSNFKVSKTFSLSNIIGNIPGPYASLSSLVIADNGTGIVSTSDSIYVYDFSNEKPIFKDRIFGSTIISSQGNYFIQYSYFSGILKLYKIQNGVIQKIGEIQNAVDYASFNPKNDDEFFYYSAYGNYNLVSCSTFVKTKTVTNNTTLVTICNMDPVSGDILVYKSEKLYRLNWNTGTLDSIIKGLYSNSYRLISSTLYASGGYKIKLSDIQ